MRITGPTDPRLVAAQRTALAALPRLVTVAAEPAAAAPLPLPLVQAQTSVAMLVAIAAVDPEARRRSATAGAAKGLRALERLHDELRVGGPAIVRLREIAAWMNDHDAPEDREAAALLREVELRVLVELAKAEFDA